jgi:hemoglobin/transferrin/lactoferrin receptor protein
MPRHSIPVLKLSARLLLGTALAATAAAAEEDALLLEEIVISSDRAGGTPLDVAANVTVIGEEELQNRDVKDLEDLLRTVPGVDISRQTSSTDPFNTIGGITIRGVGGNRVALQVDGSRVAERITDGTRDYFDFSFTKQAEVVRGPASVKWGADALGGMLALQTLDPEDILEGQDRAGRAKLSFDSLTSGTEAEAIVAQRFSDQVTFMLGLKRSQAHEIEKTNARADGGIYGCPRNFDYGATHCGELDPSDVTATRLLSKLVWTPNAQHRLEFSADHLERQTDVVQKHDLGPVYSSMTGAPTGAVNLSRDRHLDLSRQRFGLEHSWTPAQGWLDEVKTTLAYVPHSYESLSFKSSTSATGDSLRTTDILNYSEDFYELDIQATKSFVTGGIDHYLIFGFDGDYAATDYQRISRVNNLTAGTSTETRAGGFNFANAETTRADIYAENRMTFAGGRFELTPGLRFATYRIEPKPDADYQVVPGAAPVTRKDSELLASLGAQYHINDSYTVWAKYGEGFKMPTAQQLFQSLDSTFFDLVPAPGLRPESVKSYEIGLRYERERGYTAVNLFKSDYDDFIQSFYNIPGTSQYTYRNLSEVSIWGLEMSGAWDLNSHSWLSYAAAWQKGTQRANASAAKTAHDLSPLTATLTYGYALPQYDLTLEAVATVAGRVKETADPDGYKPAGYALLDLYGKWQLAPNAVLNVGVQNVFDKRYFTADAIGRSTSASDAVARANPLELMTGAGRSFQVSLNVGF